MDHVIWNILKLTLLYFNLLNGSLQTVQEIEAKQYYSKKLKGFQHRINLTLITIYKWTFAHHIILTNSNRTAQEGVGFFSVIFMFSSLFFYFVSSEIISKFFEDT